jgi:hypothetical protein
MAAGRFTGFAGKFLTAVSRSFALWALLAVSFPPQRMFADDRTPLPFDEGSFIGELMYDKALHHLRVFSIQSDLAERAHDCSSCNVLPIALKEGAAFPIFELTIVYNPRDNVFLSSDLSPRSTLLQIRRLDLTATEGHYYDRRYGSDICPYEGKTLLRSAFRDMGRIEFFYIDKYGFTIHNTYPYESITCPAYQYFLDTTLITKIIAPKDTAPLLKDYCFPAAFKKVLEEKVPELLGNPEIRFVLNRESYCGGACEEGEYYDEESKTCEQKTTIIYYVNGILNSETDAASSLRLLKQAYGGYLKDEFEGERFDFEVAYNYSYGAVKDILEVIYQKQIELNYRLDLSSYDIFLIVFAVGDLLYDDFGNLTENAAALEFDKISLQSIWEYYADVVARHNDNAGELNGKLGADLQSKKRAILIAHSQGNLFANQMMQAYGNDPQYRDSLAMIGLASPAALTFNKTRYWTADDDRVINALRVKFSGAILPANIDNDPGILNDFRDTANHSFALSYFDMRLPSRQSVNAAFAAFIQTLRFPNTEN